MNIQESSSPDIDLFSPIQLGPYTLPNRIIMAPMMESKIFGRNPQPAMVKRYSSAGLIVTECTMISPLSNGYVNCPGIYSSEQVADWQQVTDAVHTNHGHIFLQLWHSGRVAHSSMLNGKLPVAPSAIAGVGQLNTLIGRADLETPWALATEEISGIIEQFHQGAENALAAGFDGIELHAASGYLIDQFLQDGSNQRTDEYGGSIENRARFLLTVLEAVTSVCGSDRVGIRLSPSNTFYGMQDSDPKATFTHVIKALNHCNLAYLHLMEPTEMDIATRDVLNPVASLFRTLYTGILVSNGSRDTVSANAILSSGEADAVSFDDKFFMTNPHLFEQC